MSAYDIELKPKVVDNGELKKLQEQIKELSSKRVTISLTENLKTNTTPEELAKFIKAAQKIQTLDSGDKTMTLKVDTIQAGKDLDAILDKIKGIKSAAKSVALNLSIQQEGVTEQQKINDILNTAKEIQGLRSGEKKIALSVDVSKVGEQIDKAMALIQNKIGNNVPTINSNIGVDSKGIADELDNASGKPVSFDLNVNTNIDTQGLQSLMDQVDRIVALTPDDITKTVGLEVNVDNFTKEIQEALGILNSINPNLITSSEEITKQFDIQYRRYTTQLNKLKESVSQFTGVGEKSDFLDFGSKKMYDGLDRVNKVAQELYNSLSIINSLTNDNEFLKTSRYEELSDMPDINKLLGNYKKEIQGSYINELEAGTEEVDKFNKRLSDAFQVNTDPSKLEEGLDELAKVAKGSTSGINNTVEVIKEMEALTDKVNAKMKNYASQINVTLLNLKNALVAMQKAFVAFDERLKQSNEGIFASEVNAINDLSQSVDAETESLKDMATYIKTISDSITKITTPFDVENFTKVDGLLKTIKAEYQEIIDTYSGKEVDLTVKTNLDTAFKNTKENIAAMIAAQKKFEKWQAQYQKEHPVDEATATNASGSQAVIEALKEYNNILSGDNKEITLSFDQTGLYEIQSAYNEIVDKIVTIEFELANFDIVKGAVDKLNEAGATDGDYSVEPRSLTINPESLASVNTGISNVVTKLGEILTLLPTLKLETIPSESDNDNNITPSIDLINQNVGSIKGLLDTISGKINQPSETERDSVTKGFIGGMYIDIQNRLSRIASLLELIDGKVTAQNDSDDRDPEDTITNSLLDGIRTGIDQASAYVNEINEKLATLLTLNENNKKNTKDDIGVKIDTKVAKIYDLLKQKLENVPTRLSNIQQSNSSISQNTKATQTNTGTASSNIRSMYTSLGSKADKMVAQLAALNTTIQRGATIGAINPDSLNNANADKLSAALNALTAIMSAPQSSSDEEVRRKGLLPIAGMMPNVNTTSPLQTQAADRIKDFQRAIDFIGARDLNGVFGSRTEIESYINALKQLNNEIATAGKILNRNDATKEQRKEASERITNASQSLQSFMNGNSAVGISADRISNISQLITTLNNLNSRVGSVDQALPNIEKLQSTLKTYNVSIEPINKAVDGLTDVKRRLGNMMTELQSSNLDEATLTRIGDQLTQTQNDFNTLITQSNEILNTNNPDSFQSVSKGFVEAEAEVKKYSTQIEKLKNFLQKLKDAGVDFSNFNMGNGQSAKDMESFITQYEHFLNANKNITSVEDMRNFANNFRTNYQAPLAQYTQGIGEAQRQLREMNRTAAQNSSTDSITRSVNNLITQMTKWKNANAAALKNGNFKQQFDSIFSELSSGTISSTQDLNRLKTAFSQLNRDVVQAGLNTKSFTTKLKEMFKKYGGWTLVTKTMNTAMRLLRNMVTQVKEVDTAMTNLKKVTEATGNQLNTFLESAGTRSVALGASLTDYIDAVSEFSRLGKSLDEAQKLGELATTYKTVAEDLDIKTASKSIISTMQAFNGIGVQADEIVDKFNYVGRLLPLITISVKIQRWTRPS